MNKNKTISFTFVLVLFYFLINSAFLYINSHLNRNKVKSTNKIIDWKKLYPFPNKKNEIKSKFNLLININDKLKSKINRAEQALSSYIPNKYKICEIQMAFEKLIEKKLFLEYDGLVVLNNNYLEYWKKYKSPQKAFEDTLIFVEFLNSNNTDFVFVQYPCKNSKYDNKLPLGLKDNNNFTCDEFIYSLNYNNIKTLDLRNKTDEHNQSQYDMFFKTDHHWKPSAGLWASKEICKYLKQKMKWEIDISLLEKTNFKTTILSKFFLGSQGKKITLSYAQPEDFELIEPLYQTSFQRICPEWGNATGTFKEIMFCEKYIDKCDYYKLIPYDYYLNGNAAYLKLINNSDKVFNKKVLLIRDSFSSVVSPFLALCIRDLTMVDPRYFNGSIKTIIEKEKFDLVIMAYNANCITTSKVFDIK